MPVCFIIGNDVYPGIAIISTNPTPKVYVYNRRSIYYDKVLLISVDCTQAEYN